MTQAELATLGGRVTTGAKAGSTADQQALEPAGMLLPV
jgi:hypothetical protein